MEMDNDEQRPAAADNDVLGPRPVVFIKTHKTASSTASAALRNVAIVLGLRLFVPPPHIHAGMTWDASRPSHAQDMLHALHMLHSDTAASSTPTSPSLLDVWASHVCYNEAFRSFVATYMPLPPLYVTIVRHPVDRFISTFYWRRGQHHTVSRTHLGRRVQTWRETGRFPPDAPGFPPPGAHFDGGYAQMRVLLDDPEWIFMVAERMDDSLCLVAHHARLPPSLLRVEALKVNVNAAISSRDRSFAHLDASERDWIEMHFADEAEVYRRSVARLEARIAAIDPDVWRRLRKEYDEAVPARVLDHAEYARDRKSVV